MKLILVASNYFPMNDVSSLRIHSYCKALAKKGIDITILIVYGQKGFQKSQIYVNEGVKFQFLENYISPSKGKFSKFFRRISGFLTIHSFIRTHGINAVLTYHDNFFSNIFIRMILINSSIPYIIDKTEYPYGYKMMSQFKKKWTHLNLRLFDGFIVISDELSKFYSQFSKKVFLLPMTIDPDRFSNTDEITDFNEHLPYIALTFGTHNRDGLFDSVRTYFHYLNLNPSKKMKLLLIGDFPSLVSKFPEMNAIQHFLVERGLSDLVIFAGKQSLMKVPSLLRNATCLLTTAKEYVSGGFPTKLGEYMLSGVPVVATNAGEISQYVNNGEDIFLCNVQNYQCLAEHIFEIQNNSELGKLIGQRAIQTASIKFNASTYITQLLNFIKHV
ncbi:glycosyltransferase family 4 protein [Sphingobacterium mizutaii]|uniref:glycosyltransferase family 4 protein n=1 Tax=Sphingobacterium mizutaii TaxID=1010 RepID=UPI001627B7BB|nr:glycosyltransferase [Sphingobacterium mizutaii]